MGKTFGLQPLSGWRLDILSESNAAARTAEAIFNLMLMPNADGDDGSQHFSIWVWVLQAIADAEAEDVSAIPGYEDEPRRLS